MVDRALARLAVVLLARRERGGVERAHLEKCGFGVIATERNVAEARSAEIEELVLRLDELAPTE